MTIVFNDLNLGFRLHFGWVCMMENAAKELDVEFKHLESYRAVTSMNTQQPDIRVIKSFHHDLVKLTSLNFSIDAAKQVSAFTFEAISVLLWTSKNFEEFLTQLRDAFILISGQFQPALVEAQDHVEFLLLENSTPNTYKTDITGTLLLICTILEIMRQINGNSSIPCEIYLPFELPYEQKEKLAKRYGCSQVYRADVRKIKFKKENLHGISANHKPELNSTMLKLVSSKKNEAFEGDLISKICQTFDALENLQGVSIDTVATSLNTSTRTLSRRLAESGTNFKTIFNNYRLTQALILFKSTNLSLNEVAYKLGFSEQSGFSKAFRRWTGVKPIDAKYGNNKLAH
ncbi:helix-turn-helix domain-containing protein [Vibrio parahaemolyticus]|uniref:helix-turn-helix domain-containing protein n=1 Tax=Vibrio mediterranei TaxID=689 RepID=UPI004067D0DE